MSDSTRSSPSSRPRCRPVLELLEPRLALRCTVNFNPFPRLLEVRCTGEESDLVHLTTEQNRFIRYNGQPIERNPTVDNTIRIFVDGGPDNDWIDMTALSGYRGRTTLLGGRGDDVILGSGVFDLIQGGGGDDYAFGYEGNDTLEGNAGNDYLEGGDGDDVIFLGNSRRDGPGRDEATLEYGFGGCGNDHLIGDLHGMSYDYLEGGCGNDTLDGLGLDDTLLGAAGNDNLRGGSGDDSLDGGDDEDWLYGDDGNDFLDGGAGPDHLSGGAGYDFFRADEEDRWDKTCDEPF